MLPKGMTLCVWVWIVLLLRYGHVTPSTPKTVWPCLWKVRLGMGHFCCGSKIYAVLTVSLLLCHCNPMQCSLAGTRVTP